jgi:23S rRNA pseudouridine1911/1915/1917 synthase
MDGEGDMMKTTKQGEWCHITVPASWHGRTIEDILKMEWGVPKKLLHQFRMDKAVLYKSEAVRWSEKVEEGETLSVCLFKQEEYDVKPEAPAAAVLYEDDHVLIVNKPVQLDTHPTEKGGTGTLANHVAYHLQEEGVQTKVRHIHRLDKDTTGAVVFAKHALAGAIMDRLLLERAIKRTYIALVNGKLQAKQGVINAPIGRDRHHPTRRRVSPKGDAAVTHYNVIRYLPEKNISLVELELDTGRTHQIRVHMSHMGHPLLGDVLYGGSTSYLKRQALHAAQIRLQHPITGENLTVQAPLPVDLQTLL